PEAIVGGADRRSAVLGGRDDVHVPEFPLAEDALVGDAVERHPAGVAEVGARAELVEAAGEMEQRLLQSDLRRAGEVLVLGLALGPAVGMVDLLRYRVLKPEAAVDEVEEVRGREGRLAVGSEAHHLAGLMIVAEDLPGRGGKN